MEGTEYDIAEKLLDLMNPPPISTPIFSSRCENCHRIISLHDEELASCRCGLEIEEIRCFPESGLAIACKRSMYKPVLYGRQILCSIMGLILPVASEDFRSLLNDAELKSLLVQLKDAASTLQFDLNGVNPSVMRILLRTIKKGKYYRYSIYLTSVVNPNFKPVQIPLHCIDRILVCFRAVARYFYTHKLSFNKHFNTKRKSLPHVPTMLRTICRHLNLMEYTRDLPHMASPRREQRIEEMANYLVGKSNFLLNEEYWSRWSSNMTGRQKQLVKESGREETGPNLKRRSTDTQLLTTPRPSKISCQQEERPTQN